MNLRTGCLGHTSNTKSVRDIKQDPVCCYFPHCLDTKSDWSNLRKWGLLGLTVQREVHHGEEGRRGKQKDEAAGCTVPSQQADRNVCSAYFLLISPGPHSAGRSWPQLQWVFLYQLTQSISQACPETHLLDGPRPVELTILIDTPCLKENKT